MIDLATETGFHADLVEILTNDLCEIGDLAAEMVDPEHTEAARAALRAWSPRGLASTLAAGMIDG
jgi:hypothetical protein